MLSAGGSEKERGLKRIMRLQRLCAGHAGGLRNGHVWEGLSATYARRGAARREALSGAYW